MISTKEHRKMTTGIAMVEGAVAVVSLELLCEVVLAVKRFPSCCRTPQCPWQSDLQAINATFIVKPMLAKAAL